MIQDYHPALINNLMVLNTYTTEGEIIIAKCQGGFIRKVVYLWKYVIGIEPTPAGERQNLMVD